MEEMKLLKVYSLVNKDGDDLQLRFGIMENVRLPKGDTGYRWSFLGTKIPMPVRSDTWFNGFPAETMLEWLKGNGWEVQLIVNTITGRTEMFTTSFNHEHNKGNEEYQLSELAIRQGKEVLTSVVNQLCKSGQKISAIKLYRLVCPCCLSDANHAVNNIYNNA